MQCIHWENYFFCETPMIYKLKILAILVFISFLWLSCNESQEKPLDVVKMPQNDSELHLLLFKAERTLEIWNYEKKNGFKKLSNTSMSMADHYPIGVFDWQTKEQNQIKVNFPNRFYHQKQNQAIDKSKWKLEMNNFHNQLSPKNQVFLDSILLLGYNDAGKLLVFPSDARNVGHFTPCINCPHWTPELFTTLEFYLKAYK